MFNTTFSEIAPADHFVPVGFKQAGTGFPLLTQKPPVSGNSLGSVRHLPHTPQASVGWIGWGFTQQYLWVLQHSSCISPRLPTWHLTHIPASRWVPAVPRTPLSLPFLGAEPTEIPSTPIQPLPSLSLTSERKPNAIYSQPASLGGSHNTIFLKSIARQMGSLNYWANFHAPDFRDLSA